MRTSTLLTLFSASLAAGRLFDDNAYLMESRDTPIEVSASPVSAHQHAPTLTPAFAPLELRQALVPVDGAPVAAPAVDSAVAPQPEATDPAVTAVPTAEPAPAPVVNPVPTVAPVSATIKSSARSSASAAATVAAPLKPLTTLTTSSVVPTVAAPAIPPAPVITTATTLPAGADPNMLFTVEWRQTLIGGTYSTWYPKTISFRFGTEATAPLPGKGEIGMGTLTGQVGQTKTAAGAAPTQAAVWKRGVAVAVGVGLAGMVV